MQISAFAVNIETSSLAISRDVILCPFLYEGKNVILPTICAWKQNVNTAEVDTQHHGEKKFPFTLSFHNLFTILTDSRSKTLVGRSFFDGF